MPILRINITAKTRLLSLCLMLLTFHQALLSAESADHKPVQEISAEELLKELRRKYFEASEEGNINLAREQLSTINHLLAKHQELLVQRPGLRSRLNCQLSVMTLPRPSKRTPMSGHLSESELLKLEAECFEGVEERPNEYSPPDSYYKIARLLCLTNETLCSQVAQKRVQQERSNPLRKGTYFGVKEAWKDARSFSPTCRKGSCARESLQNPVPIRVAHEAMT